MRMIEFREALDNDLGATTEFSNEELERAIRRAVADLSRYVPRQRTLDITISIDVTDEAFTTAAAAGTWVTLANKPIEPGSVTVKLTASPNTEYTLDTDYEMDYIGGRVRHIDGGAMSDDTAHEITYKKSATEVDLTGTGAADAFSVHTVEYPYGQVPFESRSFRIYDNILMVVADESSQAKMTAGKHLLVRYLTFHDPPSITNSGTFPRVLDEVVAKGAAAYALWALADRQSHLAVTDMASVRTSLAKTADVHTDIADVREVMYESVDSSNDRFQKAIGGFLEVVGAVTSTLDEISTTGTGPLVLAETRIEAAYKADTSPLARAADELVVVLSSTDLYTELDSTLNVAEKMLKGSVGPIGASDVLDGVPSTLDTIGESGGELYGVSDEIADTMVNIEEVAHNLVSGRSSKGGTDDKALGDLAEVPNLLSEASSALGKVDTSITTDMAAKIDLADDKVTSETEHVRNDNPAEKDAETYLDAGDNLINTVNVGENAPGHYRNYAETTLGMAQAMAGQRDAYITEAGQYISAAQAYVNEASQRIGSAGRRVEAAQARIAIANSFLGEVQVKVQAVRERINHGAQKLEQVRTKVSAAQQLIQASGAYTAIAVRRLESITARVESAAGWIQLAGQHLESADRYIAIGMTKAQEASTRLGLSRAYLEEADVTVRYHSDHTREVRELVGQIRTYIDEATSYRLASQASSELSVSIRAEGNDRYLEFRGLMINAAKLYNQGAIASPLQNP